MPAVLRRPPIRVLTVCCRAALSLAALIALGLVAAASATAAPRLEPVWPVPGTASGSPVTIDSFSPFVPSETGSAAPPARAEITWFPPEGAQPDRPAPAVVLVHGASGVLQAREITYARQLAAMGIGAAVVDVFGARRAMASGFQQRLLAITETMAMADAYATLAWLAGRPEIDPSRVVLWGFSYGAMAARYAASRAVADRFAETFALGDVRFAGHIAFYGPCIASFDDPATTGAPILMAWGDADALINAARCQEEAAALRRGGSPVTIAIYEGALHQWDGGRAGPRMIGRRLDDCDCRIGHDLEVTAEPAGLPMTGSLARRIILALCVGEDGYLIGADEAVRARSNADVTAFLARVFGFAPQRTGARL